MRVIKLNKLVAAPFELLWPAEVTLVVVAAVAVSWEEVVMARIPVLEEIVVQEGVAHFNNQEAAESDVNPVCMGHAIEWERQDSVLAFVHGACGRVAA